MFGNINKSAFGATAQNTGFGFGASTSTANPFGQNQNLFAKPATAVFGSPSTSTFGQPQANSMFPSTQPQQTNLFQNTTSTFGVAPTTQSGFGSNLFGQQPQANTGGIFNTSSTFGQQNKPATFGFGSTQNQPSLFGQQPAQQTNVFQTSATPLFGANTSFGAQSGTTIKFNPVTGTDTMIKNGVSQNINTKHLSITCMKEYENKSFEELRLEDYQANRKGAQQQTGFGATPFGGTPASTSSLFGQTDTAKAAFGQTSAFGTNTSTFGQNTSTGFGMGAQNTSSGLFGAKPTAFGTPTSTSTIFGGLGAPPQNANPFGAPQANKTFGTTTQPFMGTNTMQPSTGGFGTGLFGQTNTQSTGSLFGKPAQPITSFAQPTQNTGFSFNTAASTQSSTLFGANNKSLFGQTSTTPGFGMGTGFGSTFNKPATTGFGAVSQAGFGTNLGMQNTSTSLFGNTQNKPGGLFGNTGSTGLFGNTTNTFNMGNTSFGLGQPQQQTQSLFPQNDQNQHSNLSLLTSDPFGDAPHLKGLEPKLKSNENVAVSATDPKELKSLLDASKKVEISYNPKLKVIPLKSIKDSLFEGMSKNGSDSLDNSNSDYVKSNVRRLVLKNKSKSNSSDVGTSPRPRSNILDILENEENKENSKTKEKSIESRANSILNLEIKTNPVRLNFDNTVDNEIHNDNVQSPSFNLNLVQNTSTPAKEISTDTNINTPASINLADDENVVNASGDNISNLKNSHPTGISCTRPEYYTLPHLDALTQYIDENGACIVKGFTIGRKGYGNVYFPDEMNVAGLNIDELVHFRYREINLYPDESKKPPVGQGLNRRAQVTLDNVYPRKSGSNTLIKDSGELLHMNFAEKLRKVTEKKGARFVDYRPETGSWVFKVDHFSKYGYNDSDEDLDENTSENKKVTQKNDKVDSKSINEAKKSENISQKISLEDDIYVDNYESHDNEMLDHQTFLIPPPIDTYDDFKSSKSIQIMKSTLFGDDDRSSDDAASHISIIKQYLDIQDEIMPTMPIIHEDNAPYRKKGVIRPEVYEVNNFFGGYTTIGSLPNSIYTEPTLYKAKSFKVGFGKGFKFYDLNVNKDEFNGEVVLNVINNERRIDPLKEILDKTLKTVLNESSVSVSSENMPTFKILSGFSYLQKQLEIFEKLSHDFVCLESKYMYSIWSLCDSLWGPYNNSIHVRRNLLSEWLKTNCITDNINLKSQQFFSINETFESVFNHLSTFKIYDAADICMANRMPNLSMIVSQLSLKNSTKIFMQEQVETWYNSLISNHICDDLKKIYLLLSGIPQRDEVNIFENIDWKRAFAMHFWYISPNGAPIETAVDLYRESFENFGYSQKPNAFYVDNMREDCSFDIIYHILLLYRSGIHRLSSVLNPGTHTDDPLDYRLSWIILQLFLSLNVGIIDDNEIKKITTSFSNQLENNGLWEWSIFVLLYLNDDSLKQKMITEILERNLSMECDKKTLEQQYNLVVNMEIPPEIIHSVKAEKLILNERYYEAYDNLILAKNYTKASEILTEKIVPTLFINEEFEVLEMFINMIKKGSKVVQNYENTIGMFDDFLKLQNKVVSFTDDEILRLQMELQDITSKIKFFPNKSDEQKLCVAELSKRCICLYRELSKKQNSNVFKDTYVQLVENLVMPPDYTHLEVMNLIYEEIN